MKKSPETMLAICDNLAAGLSYSGAALAAGVAPRTMWLWIKNSQRGDEDLIIDFLGERVPFHRAVTGARRIMLHEARSRFERRSYLGHDQIVTFGGRVCWQEEPRAVGLDPDTRELLGFERDGLIRDASGACIPLTEHHQPPIAAVLRVLEVAFDEYTPKTKTNVTQNVSGIVGVQVVKAMTGPPAIPPAPMPPPLPQLEILADDLAELLGPMPASGRAEDKPEPMLASERGDIDEPEPEMVSAPEPEPVIIQTPTPPEYAPPSNPLIRPRTGRPLSDLERDLLSRLPSALNRKA